MPIDPNRLMELRKRKRLSRAQLAEKSRISQRQIARLESGAAAESKARDMTVNNLAKALAVEPGVLTGETPMPAASAPPHCEGGRSRQVSAQLQPEVRLAYTLIKRRYGVNLTTLVNIAPLMFVLLAEGSLGWRREKLKDAEEVANRLWSLGSAYRTLQLAAGLTQEGASFERRSIEGHDLFGEIVRDHAWETHHLDGVGDNNPFAEYLRDLAVQIDDQDIVDIQEGDIHDRGPLKNFPEFTVCNGDLDRFTGADERLNLALRMGWLRVDRLPDEFLDDEAAGQRRDWLEQQLEDLPEKSKDALEGILSLDLSLSEAEGEGADP